MTVTNQGPPYELTLMPCCFDVPITCEESVQFYRTKDNPIINNGH